MSADGHRDRDLRDADLGPAVVTDDLGLRVGLALLDFADVEDGQTGLRTVVGDVGDVEAVPVVADVHAVGRPLGSEPQRHGRDRIGDVQGREGVPARRTDPEGVAVGRERALMAEDAER